MKNAIKIAFGIAVATVGIAACTATPVTPNAAPVTPDPLPVPSSSSSTVVTEITTVTVTNPPKPDSFAKVDNRLGYGAIKLEMTLDEARAAGLTNLTWDSKGDGRCVADGELTISKRYGIVRITLPAEAKTSKGIGVGSTAADVKKAYPYASEYRGSFIGVINTVAFYSFRGLSKVERVDLQAAASDCEEWLY